MSLLFAEDLNKDNGHRNETYDCFAALDEICNEEDNGEESNATLLCLYTLSKIRIRMKRKRLKNVGKQ